MTQRRPEGRTPKRPGWRSAVAVAVALFVGFWAFVYQGYVEDAGMEPVRSWPVGAIAFAFAGGVVIAAVHRARPGLGTARLALVTLLVTALLCAAVVGSLDAGNR